MLKFSHNSLKVKIYDCSDVRELIHRICLPYWLDKGRLEQRVNELPIKHLLVRLKTDYSYHNIIHNKVFSGFDYDIVMKDIKNMPIEDLLFNSDKFDITINNNEIAIDFK